MARPVVGWHDGGDSDFSREFGQFTLFRRYDDDRPTAAEVLVKLARDDGEV